MKVIVSACLAGDNCKYNGGNNFNQKMMDFLKSYEMIKVCPEVLGGLSTPRPSAEIVNGQVMNTEGKNITKEFSQGARLAFEIVQKENPDLIILQSRSPSCGIKQIYDGTFSGNKIPGHGLFAELCIKAGYKVLDIEDIEEYLCNSMKQITVSGAIILRTNLETNKKEIFATQRGYGDYKDGWEIPGGKLEPGETPQQCIEREIREELATQVKAEKILGVVDYDYPTFHLTMHCILCTIVSGELKLLEHEVARWLSKDTLRSVDWLPADQLILDKIEEIL